MLRHMGPSQTETETQSHVDMGSKLTCVWLVSMKWTASSFSISLPLMKPAARSCSPMHGLNPQSSCTLHAGCQHRQCRHSIGQDQLMQPGRGFQNRNATSRVLVGVP